MEFSTPVSIGVPQRTPRVRLIETAHPRYRWVVTYCHRGVRRTAYFKNGEKQKAEAKRCELEAEVHRLGTSVVSALDDRERRYLADAKAKLAGVGKTFEDALNFYFESLKTNDRRCTVGQMTDKLVAFKSREGVSKRYQYDLEQKLFRFCRTLGTKQIADVTTEHVSDWLQKLHDDGLAANSINCYRRAISVLFGYAIANGYISSNPAKHAFKPKVRTRIGILTPQEMTDLLRAAHPDIVPAIAISGFAGLRRSEVERLQWTDIDFANQSTSLGDGENLSIFKSVQFSICEAGWRQGRVEAPPLNVSGTLVFSQSHVADWYAERSQTMA